MRTRSWLARRRGVIAIDASSIRRRARALLAAIAPVRQPVRTLVSTHHHGDHTCGNNAYVFTASPKRADPASGPRPAPELACYDRLASQASDRSPAALSARPEDTLGVLGEVLGRDGQQSSPSQI